MNISAGAKAFLETIPRVCWMTERNLAKLMGVRASKIKLFKAELEAAGLIKVISHPNGKRPNPRHEIIKLSNFGSPICKHILKSYCLNEWSWLERNALIECYLKTGMEIVPFKTRAKQPIEGFCAPEWKRLTETQKMDFFFDHPELNVGLVLCSHLTVVDVDSKTNPWIEHESFETTLTASTPRGFHFYFRRDPAVETSSGTIPGIDTRCRSNYVVLPPSIHPTGEPYRWEVLRRPNPLPADFRMEWLRRQDERRRRPDSEAFSLPEILNKGVRNDFLWRYGRSMRSRGSSFFEIQTALTEINRQSCIPPLPLREIQALIENVWTRANRKDF